MPNRLVALPTVRQALVAASRPALRAALRAALVCLAVAAQAQQPAIRVRVILPAYRHPVAIDTIMLVTTHDAPAGAVWKAAEKVFYDLKITTDRRDSVGGIIGVVKYVKSSYMGKEPMSRVFNCGQSITGPNADNFRINMALVALVSAKSPTKSQLGVGFAGSGLDMRGSSTDPVVCASTGWLEADFAERVKAILKGAP